MHACKWADKGYSRGEKAVPGIAHRVLSPRDIFKIKQDPTTSNNNLLQTTVVASVCVSV